MSLSFIFFFQREFGLIAQRSFSKQFKTETQPPNAHKCRDNHRCVHVYVLKKLLSLSVSMCSHQ